MPFSPSSHDLGLLSRAPLYAALPDPARVSLLERCHQLILKRGDTVFSQGELAENVFMVLEGWLKVYRLTPEGGETVLHVFRPGETFAEPAAFGLGRYPATAEAASEGRVLVVPAAALMAEIHASPALALKVISQFSLRLQALVAETERRQFLSTRHRLAVFLLDLLEKDVGPAALDSDQPCHLPLPYDKALVAARLGMTPESFSRAMGKLRSAGVESNGSTVTIQNPGKLRDSVPLHSEE